MVAEADNGMVLPLAGLVFSRRPLSLLRAVGSQRRGAAMRPLAPAVAALIVATVGRLDTLRHRLGRRFFRVTRRRFGRRLQGLFRARCGAVPAMAAAALAPLAAPAAFGGASFTGFVAMVAVDRCCPFRRSLDRYRLDCLPGHLLDLRDVFPVDRRRDSDCRAA